MRRMRNMPLENRQWRCGAGLRPANTRAALMASIVAALLAGSSSAQWMHYPTPGIPRTRDGKPNLSGPSPRASDGKPDLSGLWQVEPTPSDEMTRLFGPDIYALSVPGDDPRNFSKYVFNILADFK